MTPVSAEARAVAARLNKKLGDGTVVLGADIKHRVIPRITTGSIALDVILGGGWPANQWNEIIGEESHGKTTVALKTIAANQALDPNWICVWIAAEQFVEDWAIKLGVDVDRVIVVDTNIMEEAYEAAIAFAESRAVDGVVIDSLPMLVPLDEDTKDMDEMTVGRAALLTGKFFRKVGKATKRSLLEEERPVLGLCINQFRQKIGVMYGDNRTTPGGLGKNYAFFTRVEVRRDEWLEVGPKGNKRRVGQAIKCRTVKNKTAPPQQVALVDFYFRAGGECDVGQYDYAKEIVGLAILRDVVTRRGSVYDYEGHRFRGREELLEAIRADETLRKSLENDVMSTLAKVPTQLDVDEDE